jgi:hypothetical protein
MSERAITLPDILEVLRRGSVTEGPFLNTHRNWQATMTRFAAGQEIQVAVVIDDGVIVITAY